MLTGYIVKFSDAVAGGISISWRKVCSRLAGSFQVSLLFLFLFTDHLFLHFFHPLTCSLVYTHFVPSLTHSLFSHSPVHLELLSLVFEVQPGPYVSCWIVVSVHLFKHYLGRRTTQASWRFSWTVFSCQEQHWALPSYQDSMRGTVHDLSPRWTLQLWKTRSAESQCWLLAELFTVLMGRICLFWLQQIARPCSASRRVDGFWKFSRSLSNLLRMRSTTHDWYARNLAPPIFSMQG